MDEGLGRSPRVTPGISHREISWRDERQRVLLGIGALPAWVDAVVLAGLSVYLVLGLSSAAPSRSEAVQIGLTRDAGVLVRDPGALLPGEGSAAEDAVRLGYGSLTRLAAAPGWFLAAGRHQPRPLELAGVDGRVDHGAAQVTIRPVAQRDLVAARAGPAGLAVLSLFMLFFLTRRLLGRPAATVAVLIFALQPAVLLTGRQVCDSGTTALFGLMAIFVATGIGAQLAGGDEPALGAWTGLGLTAGLCLAAGLSAAPYLAGAAAFCLAGVVAGHVRRQRALLAGQPEGGSPAPPPLRVAGWLLVSMLLTVLTWVLLSPALWGWLPQRLQARHDDRSWLIARGLVDDPGDRGLTGRLHALPRLLDGPHASLLLYAGAIAGLLVLLGAAWSQRLANLSHRVAAGLLLWALGTVLWFVAWPSVAPEHEVPLLVVASLMAASLVAWVQNSGVIRWGSAVRTAGSGRSDQFGDDRG